MSFGFTMLLAAVGPADPLTWSSPRLSRGDELVYTGEILEASDRVENRFKKRYELEVRVFVLDSNRDSTDCGVLTSVRPLGDPLVAAARSPVAVERPNKATPAVRIDLIRVDDRGRVRVLAPPAQLPLQLTSDTPTVAPPSLPIDTPPLAEFGLFLPLPVTAVTIGSTWDVSEPNRPPVVWSAKGESVWNGRRCVEATGSQQSDGYDRPQSVPTGWKRVDTVLVSPIDGFASSVCRTMVRREGREEVGTVTVKYELQPSNKWVGVKYQEARAELEAAWVFAEEYATLMARRARPDEIRARMSEIDRYLSARPAVSGYRAAVEAVKRRYEAGVTGVAPPVTPKIVITPIEAEAPRVGQPTPDFTVPDVDKPTGRLRLSATRGRPAVVVFYKPGSETSIDTLAVCEALHRKYAGAVTVIPLAVFAPPTVASQQRTETKCSVPVYDGVEVVSKYGVESVPRFLILDAKGTLRWSFNAGIGPEVGYLVKQEVEKVLK